MSKSAKKLTPEQLRFVCDPNKIKSSSEAEPLKGLVGQERAMEALKFGLEARGSRHEDYHQGIFVVGEKGTGRKSKTIEFVREFAANHPQELNDICFVCNTDELKSPISLILPQGKGIKLSHTLETLKNALENEVAKACQKIEERLKPAFDEIKERIEQTSKDQLAAIGLAAIRDEENHGWRIYKVSPDDPNKILSIEVYKTLNAEQQKEWDNLIAQGSNIFTEHYERWVEVEIKSQKGIDRMKESYLIKYLEEEFKKIQADYGQDNAQLKKYLDGLQKYIIKNRAALVEKIDENKNSGAPNFMGMMMGQKKSIDHSLVFKVNVMANNNSTNPPVIFVDEPKYQTLFGGMGYKVVNEHTYYADHTTLEKGAVMEASGGYLILDALDMLRNNCWTKLKEVIKTGKLRVENIEEHFRGSGFIGGLTPEPVMVNVKVILIGDLHLYYKFLALENDFEDLFRVPVYFESDIKFDENGLELYASFIATVREQEKLLPFNRASVAKIVEHGVRLAHNRKKISACFGKIKDMLIESDFWAKKDDALEVDAIHVQQALEKKINRINWTEDHHKEFIKEGKQLLETTGRKVGQINGLCVYHTRNGVVFGGVNKITCRVFAGTEGVVSVQRNIKNCSGPSHDLGVEVLAGYLSGEYADKKPLSLSAKICFEQNADGVDGDSATIAETIAIISAAANVPIKQHWAVTGSMNQHGGIQPIGGVNEKIEGFFDLVKSRGLDGTHNVLIPYQNVINLQLKEELVEAVKAGLFNIWSCEDIDTAIRMMTSYPAEKIRILVQKRINEPKK